MRYWLAALSILAAVGCAGTPPKSAASATAPKDALYRDLGGTEGITKLVDAFFPRLNSDARINTLFRNVDHDDLRRLVIEQLCAATGGPCTYSGRSMEEAHSGLNLTNADFDAFVQDFTAAMNQVKVPKADQKQLLAMLAPMRADIVGK
ncbi:MAG TPA: group 1 truncated hemoglobin [Rudaea sp.]|nr:group 1 truncated hemoglobin [Rudaea sp.]